MWRKRKWKKRRRSTHRKTIMMKEQRVLKYPNSLLQPRFVTPYIIFGISTEAHFIRTSKERIAHKTLQWILND